jgi:hypothetical protein
MEERDNHMETWKENNPGSNKSCLKNKGVPVAAIKWEMWKTRRCVEGN